MGLFKMASLVIIVVKKWYLNMIKYYNFLGSNESVDSKGKEKPNQKQLAAKNATIAIFFREYICLKSNLNKSVYRNKNQRNECYRIKYVNGQLIY